MNKVQREGHRDVTHPTSKSVDWFSVYATQQSIRERVEGESARASTNLPTRLVCETWFAIA